MKKIAIILAFFTVVFNVEAQQPKFDQLEMLFSQNHYRTVYRKANRLLDNPTYDYSMLPTYYKSISLLQLAQNDLWRKRNPESIDEALKMFLKVKRSLNGEALFNAHMYELDWVKKDLMAWGSDLKRAGDRSTFKQVQQLIQSMFEGIPELEMPIIEETLKDSVVYVDEIDHELIDGKELETRDEIVENAKQFIGTPYVWAGNTPKGFDCSGYTSFVMQNYGEKLSRRSGDQFKEGRKLKAKNVQKGDLVFFSNGSGISHVGIVISEKGEPLVMIHASSSKGVIITDIESSEYWSKRLHGFATYIN